MTEIHTKLRAFAQPRAILAGVARLWRVVHFARAVRRERAALARLSPELLRDIGLTPKAAAWEASRSPLDLPPASGAGR